MTKIKDFLSLPKNRTYLYQVLKALVPILIVSGVILPGTETLILTFIGAVLGFAGNELAARNPTPEEVDEEGLGL